MNTQECRSHDWTHNECKDPEWMLKYRCNFTECIAFAVTVAAIYEMVINNCVKFNLSCQGGWWWDILNKCQYVSLGSFLSSDIWFGNSQHKTIKNFNMIFFPLWINNSLFWKEIMSGASDLVLFFKVWNINRCVLLMFLILWSIRYTFQSSSYICLTI